jgi:hypothetical protein
MIHLVIIYVELPLDGVLYLEFPSVSLFVVTYYVYRSKYCQREDDIS